jgi:hypothetical protein
LTKPTAPRELFHHELRRDGKIVALLRGIPGENGAVTVDAEVHPVTLLGVEPQRRQAFPFTSREQASRFVEATLDALQYLGCTVVQ